MDIWGGAFFKELLGTFDGILVTNHHGAYNDYAADKHQYRTMILSVIETCRRLDINLYQTLRTICTQGITQGQITFRLPIPEQKVLSGVVAS